MTGIHQVTRGEEVMHVIYTYVMVETKSTTQAPFFVNIASTRDPPLLRIVFATKWFASIWPRLKKKYNKFWISCKHQIFALNGADVNTASNLRTDAILKTARFIEVTLVVIRNKDRPVRHSFAWKIRHWTHSWTIRFGTQLGTNSTKECLKINII
jgi:hypothetical protein